MEEVNKVARKGSIKGQIISNDYKWAYDWFGYDSTCPNDIVSLLNEVNGKEDIILEMNSGGGSVIAAHEIYTAIASYTGNIEIHVVGLSGSAASEILTACKSLISPVAQIMIHNCSSYAGGDYREMDSASQMLQTINKGIRNAYKAKTGLSDEKLIELMDKTTWMSAQDALEYGFVDGIMTFDKDTDPTNTVMNMVPNNPMELNTSSGYLSEEVINKLQSIMKQKDIKNTNTENIKPALQPIPPADPQACILDNKVTNQIEGGKDVKLEDLLKEHPEIQDEINQLKVTARQEGKQEGITEERGRIQAIDKIAPSVSDALVEKAKYTEPVNAAELALQVLADTQASGQKYMAAAIEDSKKSGVDDVTSTPSDEGGEDPDDALINVAVKAANSKRKEIK